MSSVHHFPSVLRAHQQAPQQSPPLPRIDAATRETLSVPEGASIIAWARGRDVALYLRPDGSTHAQCAGITAPVRAVDADAFACLIVAVSMGCMTETALKRFLAMLPGACQLTRAPSDM